MGVNRKRTVAERRKLIVNLEGMKEVKSAHA